jgi:DNA-binding NarL/FixJ family response regulator
MPQMEIFAFVARGMSNKENARAGNYTERAIANYMTNIMQTLNGGNRFPAAHEFLPARNESAGNRPASQ